MELATLVSRCQDVGKEFGSVSLAIKQSFWEIGYLSESWTSKGNTSGASTLRKRGWVIAIELTDAGLDYQSAMKMLDDIKNLVSRMSDEKHGETLSYRSQMLDNADPYVLHELNAKKSGNAVRDAPDDCGWRDRMTKELRKHDLTWSQIRVLKHNFTRVLCVVCDLDMLFGEEGTHKSSCEWHVTYDICKTRDVYRI